ncbi:hypothetical protein Tph_c24860 [Thermacetogenium phaeum DSM 12270]|jgi:hypothetical protein|uniref:DUF2007 domain-containing protein n=2 Tax=Thermacetogenium phaeum TaxID=85874 RepID=K4LL06_THEPS|nr:hypothetical protein [Thermacetogenium phaeum]AFV12660.1 hypothetical protein Tph_c24860 [Thermacetogenium phaeum DSM 12270]KUK35998.1 MAG: Uncharacterized protein XD66_1289 [Thermacetogenium phaeum]MDK2880334.1 hypothetical protein [Clostridia bacterium]MDN5375083.1 hypothetical protein [Thermacetogenium sp.]
MKKDGLALLAVVYPPEDIIIEGVLQTAGIRAFKMRESIAPVEGITIGPLAEVKIYVSGEQLEAAKDILAWTKESAADV